MNTNSILSHFANESSAATVLRSAVEEQLVRARALVGELEQIRRQLHGRPPPTEVAGIRWLDDILGDSDRGLDQAAMDGIIEQVVRQLNEVQFAGMVMRATQECSGGTRCVAWGQIERAKDAADPVGRYVVVYANHAAVEFTLGKVTPLRMVRGQGSGTIYEATKGELVLAPSSASTSIEVFDNEEALKDWITSNEDDGAHMRP